MSKRRNLNGQQRREDYEAEADGEEAGPGEFQRASAAKLAKRRIVKARRPGAHATAVMEERGR